MQLNFLSRLFNNTPKRVRKSQCKRVDDTFLKPIWLKLRVEYFPNRPDLDSYSVRWSTRRQRRVLASVSITHRHVSVAKELAVSELHLWLEPLLYHEMCHAVIGEDVPIRRRKRQWHGELFRKLESQHPKIDELNKWIKSGGWSRAVRSHRTRQYWAARNSA